MLKNFKVILPDEVEELLKQDQLKEDQKMFDKERRKNPGTIQSTLTGLIQPSVNTPTPLIKSSVAGKGKPSETLQSPMGGAALPTTADKSAANVSALSVKANRKRDREEFQKESSTQLRGDEMSEIDTILSALRQRVLLNETLNNFKKEI